MNSTNTNVGGWDSCARRTWCNSLYKNALPSTLIGIFKEHQNITAIGKGTSNTISNDYFSLPAEKEYKSISSANSTAESSLNRFTYYNTTANRKKYISGTVVAWWLRSPHGTNNTDFCMVMGDGGAGNNNASNSRGLAPFGVI